MTASTASARSLDDIHVTRWGKGPRVVMISGGGAGDPGGATEKWSCQRPLADQGWELVLPDRPGQGDSPAQGYDDYEADGPWAAELLGDGAHLVAHSYGGAIAMCAVALRPHAVTSLTLIEAPIFSVATHRPEARAHQDAIASAMNARIPLLGLVKAFKALGIPRERQQQRPSLSVLRTMARNFQAMRPPWDLDASPAVSALQKAGTPLLFVEGGWSPGFRAIGEELTTLTGGELVTIQSGHHIPQKLDDGSEFNATLGQFLARAQSGTPAI
jgi:pimeloyl-ACP methyl ester carboxylesterase